jgi:glycosyltransferase involved in cell wall biosynthesis
MSDSQPLVSVVTPFYNTAPYLRECIESVLRQTHKHFEYVLVDNCSTDGSTEIAAESAARDARIRLIHAEKFRGQTANHNYAIAQITEASKYCKVVQADDWIYPECISAMVAVAEANPRVGIVGAYTLLERVVYLTGLRHWETVVAGRDVCRRYLLEGLYVTGSPTSTLVRGDLVRARQPRFYSEDTPVEDVEVCFDLLQDWDFGFVHQVLTFTRRDNESILSRLRTYHLGLLAELLMLEKYGPRLLDAGERRARRRVLWSAYYRKLGEALLRRRSADFWDFQEWALRSAGLHVERAQVIKGAGQVVLDVLLNPKATGERLLAARARHRAAGNGQ